MAFLFRLFAGAFAYLALATIAAAEQWPSKPLIVVTTGSAEAAAR